MTNRLTQAILRGSATAFVANAAVLGLAFGGQLVLARALGVKEFGGYMVTLAFLSLLAVPSKLGLDTGSGRLIPYFASRGEWGQLAGFLRRGILLVFASGCLVALVTATVVLWLGWYRPAVAPAVFGAMLIAVPLYATQLVQIAQLQGFRRVGLAQIPEMVRIVGVAGAVALGVWGLHVERTAVFGMMCLAASLLLAVITGALLLQRVAPTEVAAVTPESRPRQWLATSLPMSFVSAMFVVMKRTDVLMLGAMAGLPAAGAYAVASRVGELMLFGLNAANIYTGPLFAEQHTRGDTAGLQHAARLNARLGLAATALAGAFLVVAGPWIFRAFGPGFHDALPALKVLVVAQLFNAAAGSVGKLMLMTGHQIETGLVIASAVVVNISLNLVLIPRYGLVGAAWSTATATILWNAILIVRVRKLLRIRSTPI